MLYGFLGLGPVYCVSDITENVNRCHHEKCLTWTGHHVDDNLPNDNLLDQVYLDDINEMNVHLVECVRETRMPGDARKVYFIGEER